MQFLSSANGPNSKTSGQKATNFTNNGLEDRKLVYNITKGFRNDVSFTGNLDEDINN